MKVPRENPIFTVLHELGRSSINHASTEGLLELSTLSLVN
jgi:hypothetical protein